MTNYLISTVLVQWKFTLHELLPTYHDIHTGTRISITTSYYVNSIIFILKQNDSLYHSGSTCIPEGFGRTCVGYINDLLVTASL